MSVEQPTVLLATHTLAARSGTEMYTRDLASAVLRHGWRPVVYASALGPLAEEIRRATIPVVDDLERIAERPDVIHGNHGLEIAAAMLRWPDVPALFVMHDAMSWHSVPPVLDRIGAYVAVDENCRDRALLEYGVPADRLRVLANAVDLRRFRRREPLPATPRRALVFSNNARESTFVPMIRQACEMRGVPVDVAGAGAGAETATPETLLREYDVVFAKARCALEAMAVGCAVILCDERGVGGMVTSREVEHLRRLNFGARTLLRPITPNAIDEELARYDAADAARVSDTIRAAADLDVLVAQFLGIYDELRTRGTAHVDRAAEGQELSRYLQRLSRHLLLHADPTATSPAARVLQRILRSRALAPLVHRLYRLLGRPA